MGLGPMNPREAFAIYREMPDDQKERVLEIIGQLSYETTKWRLVEAVQQELANAAKERKVQKGSVTEH